MAKILAQLRSDFNNPSSGIVLGARALAHARAHGTGIRLHHDVASWEAADARHRRLAVENREWPVRHYPGVYITDWDSPDLDKLFRGVGLVVPCTHEVRKRFQQRPANAARKAWQRQLLKAV